MIDETHDPALRCWVDSAHDGATPFPIQNLPHGVFRRRGHGEAFRGGVAIGTQILDLSSALHSGAFAGAVHQAAAAAGAPQLNALMALGQPAWRALRRRLSQLLREGAPEAAALRACLVAQADAEYAVPAAIGDYTDFFTSEHHALNAGRVFRPDSPLLPQFKWLPIAYHGRASSIAISGTPFERPVGQWHAGGSDTPVVGPTRCLDYELELACYIGTGNRRGERIPIEDAESQVFGVSLLNDWSARDVQAWESVPLGPFTAKNFISTVSPWIVTLDALAPFRCPVARRNGDPPTLPHLQQRGDGAFDVQLEVWLRTAAGDTLRLSRSNWKHAYWTPAQMVAHHTQGGCNLRAGDLLGTGTQSGPTRGEEGCLLELSRGGLEPLTLPGGETRAFLHDGDSITLRAWSEREGAARIGFGDCAGTVLPASSA